MDGIVTFSFEVEEKNVLCLLASKGLKNNNDMILIASFRICDELLILIARMYHKNETSATYIFESKYFDHVAMERNQNYIHLEIWNGLRSSINSSQYWDLLVKAPVIY